MFTPAKSLLAIAIAVSLSAPAQPALAHHCFPAVFDAAAPVLVTGKIITVEWINPHALIYVKGSDAGKPEQTYVFWGSTPNSLTRSGVGREVLKNGTNVVIRGYLGKDRRCQHSAVVGAPACLADAREVTFGDGRKAFIGSAGSGAPKDEYEPGSMLGVGGWCPTKG